MKSVKEIEVEHALSRAAALTSAVEETTRTIPAQERTALLRSTHSMVANLAMALDVLRRQRASRQC